MSVTNTAMTAQAKGARPAEWAHWQGLGLLPDLLPVVSDLDAPISPHSQLKQLDGKTPTQINGRGQAAGLHGWSNRITTAREVQRWASDPRHGIGVIGRQVKAFDIDIADPARAAEAEALITLTLGQLPARRRSNSGKCLLIFRLPEEMPKQRIETKHAGEAIELLATVQQFLIAGTHKTGVRYEWDGGLPASIPTLTRAEVDCTLAALADHFSAPGGVVNDRAPAVLARPRHAADVNDPAVAWLEENDWVTGYGPDGKVFVRCPWKDQHSDDSGPSETSYMPAGLGGFAQGHWNCKHTHCLGRTDGDFVEAVGYVADAFEVVPPRAAAEVLPAFDRAKTGRIAATRGNVELALSRSDLCGAGLRYDTFRGGVMVAPHGTDEWRPIKDTDYTDLAKRMESGQTGFAHIPAALIREMVANFAEHHRFDSAQQWLAGLVWDGKPRVDTFLHAFLGAEDTPYTRAVSRYLLTALAGRVREPGIKADMAPVLVGPQGGGKSTVLAALAPSSDEFLELDLGKKDDDQAREMRGRLLVELGELRGMRTREHEALKAFISRRVDVWVPKFNEFASSYRRRSVFVGTTNTREFLADDTGHRRWLPVEVPGAGAPDAIAAAWAALDAVREQLWAEGSVLFAAGGVAWQAAETLAKREHAKFEVSEPWQEAISEWIDGEVIDGTTRGAEPFTTESVLVGAVRIELRQVQDAHRKRAAKVLRGLGYVDRRGMRGGVRGTWWHRLAADFA